jgi:UDP-N-acetyl-D-galactosamine dehydrogenase
MQIIPCVVGLGYVGLPVVLKLANKFDTFGYDINKSRVIFLKKRIDTNNEFAKIQFTTKKDISFSSNIDRVKNCNFFIVSVPTPINKKNIPDLNILIKSAKQIAKILKKDDIIFLESTVYPGVTKNIFIKTIKKYSNLIPNKDFFYGYSPERINPGDKKHNISNISKIVSFNFSNKQAVRKTCLIYKSVSKNVVYTKNIEDAETGKLIENIQRDVNIAFFNELLIFCDKINLNYKNVVKLASTKWNFLKFNPGLVGGHCLPINPYYLSSISLKNKFNPKLILTARKRNERMKNYVLEKIIKFFKKKEIFKKSKILIIGLTYKPGVADCRNSIGLEILNNLNNINTNTYGYDPFLEKKFLKNSKILKNIKNINSFDLIVFLNFHKIFKKIYKKSQKNKVLDIFYNY